MKRATREAIVVLFIILGIALAVLAWFWLSGRLDARGGRGVEVEFEDVTGLKVGDPVEVMGLNKGKVASLKLENDHILCVARIDREVELGVDARFAIRSISYLGSDRYLMVRPGGGPPAGEGHRFKGTNEALDLEETFLRLDKVVARLDPDDLREELRNTIQELVSTFDGQLGRFDHQFSSLNRNLGTAGSELQRVSHSLDTLTTLLDPGSTAGQMLTSDDLYEEVRETNKQLQALIADIKANPKRYFKVSLF